MSIHPGAAADGAPNVRLQTSLTRRLGIRAPIVQTGMGWVAGARLCAATSAAGGLGILAAATMTPAELEVAVRKVRERTDRPFGVNLRADHEDSAAIVAVMVRERVPVASFARAPGKEAIQRLKDAGIFTIATIGAPRHAEKAAGWGIDALIAQGGEGGGHTGSIPTTLLLPAVVAAVDVPVIAAGGFSDGRGLVAALAYGASAVAMGTRFLLTQESTVPDAVKQRYLQAGLTDTLVTTAVDGAPQRVVRTAFIDALEDNGWLAPARRWWTAAQAALAFQALTGASWGGLLGEAWTMWRRSEGPLAQTLMAANAPMLTKAALVDGRVDAGVLPTGQVVGSVRDLPTVAELIARILAEADVALDRLASVREADEAVGVVPAVDSERSVEETRLTPGDGRSGVGVEVGSIR
jgi:NAD(P)H-dependent flavin oxidoreductase YrpB (nitropropane dioxygenase family)